MDTTLGSIRPSISSEAPEEEASYLFARDPSILAYSQRPCPLKETQKNLFSLFNLAEESCSENAGSLDSELQSLQTVRVYLRLKPFPKKMKLSQNEQEAYQITSPTTLYTKLPALDNNTSCLKRTNSSDIVCRKFTFTKTFGPETTQLHLFEEAVKQQMLDFLAGQNSTIMTYGTTNSGKSYTLQGTTTSPGIIPRGLEFVFSNITPKAIPSYKPMNHCDVISLNPLERAQELEVKTKLLTLTSMDKHQYINTYKEMQKLLQEESPTRPSQCHDAQYSVWVSFAEIYNETIYDLLSNECQKKKTALKLATDSKGRAFIKGLKTVCVNSGSEAYQVLMAGQYNLKVAATALNARSSRSHCIFTIKLLKYFKENEAHDVEVSTFAFCDLAGSERLKKTLNIGDRLKEAQNINTSLLVLGRCLKTIHEGQLAKSSNSKQKAEHLGPFRESKLTRLFQKALSGKEHIALIVNINPLPNLYVETQNVLSFSAIAKKIVIEKEKPRQRRKSRFSQLVTQSIKSITDWDATELESQEWQTTEGDDVTSPSIQIEEYEEIVNENEQLKKEIAMLKSSALTRDLQIRKEMADTYTAMMQELEGDWKNRMKDVEQQQEDVLEWSVKQVEDFYKQKIEQLSSRKRRRSCLSDDEDAEDDDDAKNIEELESENSRLTSKVVTLKHSLKQVKEANETLTVEKNNIAFELGLTKDELKTVKELLTAAQHDVCSDDESREYLEHLQAKLFEKQDRVKKLKVFLNEAKEEYIAITAEVREKDYQLKEQEEVLVETEEKVEELESHLEHTNMCLTEKSKMVETLEDKLEAQSKQLANAKSKIEDLEGEVNLLEQEKLALLDGIKLLQTVKTGIEVQDNLEMRGPPSDSETKLSSEMDEKIKMIVSENSALKERLAQSTSEIQSLKDELELAKSKVQDIAAQICNLQVAGGSSKPDANESSTVKLDVQSVEASCQVEIVNTPEPTLCEQPMEHKWSQTSCVSTTEKVNQTSFIEDSEDNDMLDDFAKLIVKYEDLKDKYKRSCLKNSEIEECLADDDVMDAFARMIVKYEDLKDYYKDAQSSVSELEEHDNETVYVTDELTNLVAKHQDLKDEYDLSTLYKIEQDEVVLQLKKQLSEETARCDIKSQCLDVHSAKITELEQKVEGITELQTKISELNEKLEKCQLEKETMQKLYAENNDKMILDLEDRLQQAEEKEREKDAEIYQLQKDMKRMIQNAENDDKGDKMMQFEMKNTLKQLTESKELLARQQEEIDNLRVQLKTSEQSEKFLDLLQQTARERQAENDRLKHLNEELKNSLLEKDREMESFTKNRDEMVSKYEVLVKSQQEELEKQKKEITKRGTRKEKEKVYCENTSEDEIVLKQRHKRVGRKALPPVNPDEISVIELSESESKKSVRRTALDPPPLVEPLTDKKKSTRKKKLYVVDDECLHDIEPLESTIMVTPSPQTRSLRSRRKPKCT